MPRRQTQKTRAGGGYGTMKDRAATLQAMRELGQVLRARAVVLPTGVAGHVPETETTTAGEPAEYDSPTT